MAWLIKRGNVFHLGFRYSGRVFRTLLKTTDRRTANAAVSRIDENIRLMESGRLTLPDETADLATFLLSDGKLTARPELPTVTSLNDLFAAYQKAMSNGSMEENSLGTIDIHMGHLRRVLSEYSGARLRTQENGPQSVQDFRMAVQLWKVVAQLFDAYRVTGGRYSAPCL